MKRVDLTGQKFGKLTAISEFKKGRHYYIVCKCDCGKDHIVDKHHLKSRNITHCGCDRKNLGINHKQWKGCGEISGNFWYNHIVRSALADKSVAKKRRPKELTITIEYAWGLFLTQNRKCALTGIELSFPSSQNSSKNYTASLDRIDSSIGYIPGNVQWVHKHINMMKGKYKAEYFIQMCKEVAKFAGGKCEINV